MINKNTKIYGSFSKKAGSLGTKLFNLAFQYHKINAIYRSFSVDNIEEAVQAARTLKFSGFAVSMPFKQEVLNYIDGMNAEVDPIGAANTIIEAGGKFIATNTDYIAAKDVIKKYFGSITQMYILGNGGYAAAVRYAAKDLNIDIQTITRDNWNDIDDLRGKCIFNCTPVDLTIHESNKYIDCITTTDTGKELSVIQAAWQFWLYTGKPFPFRSIV